MRITVLGSCGAWPSASQACSGFLLEWEHFRLVVDLGYATLPRLLQYVEPHEVDAVFISHQHPDHCADLNPLLRARWLADERARPLPVYTLPGAVAAVLALDRPGMLDGAYDLHEFHAGDGFDIGPFRAQTRLLPHWVPNAGVRLTAGLRTITYTGDSGPDSAVVELARGADLLVAESSYVDAVPDDSVGYLCDARTAGLQAAEAGVQRLLLTHLLPGTDPKEAIHATGFGGDVGTAAAGMVVDLH